MMEGAQDLIGKKVTTLLPDSCRETVLKCTDGTEQGRHTGQEQDSKRLACGQENPKR